MIIILVLRSMHSTAVWLYGVRVYGIFLSCCRARADESSLGERLPARAADLVGRVNPALFLPHDGVFTFRSLVSGVDAVETGGRKDGVRKGRSRIISLDNLRLS